MAKQNTETPYEVIKKKILEGEYAPSQRLVEQELSDILSTGRQNIRVALNRLQAEGLVVLEPYRGAKVATLTLEETLDAIEARRILETAIIRIAAKKITEEPLNVLSDCLSGIRETLKENALDEYNRLNQLFDMTIYEVAGNKTVTDLIKLVRTKIARLHMRTILLPGRKTDSIKEHQAIFDALKNHDPEAAEAAVNNHLTKIEKTFEMVWDLIKL